MTRPIFAMALDLIKPDGNSARFMGELAHALRSATFRVAGFGNVGV
jgi:hypothetical protein